MRLVQASLRALPDGLRFNRPKMRASDPLDVDVWGRSAQAGSPWRVSRGHLTPAAASSCDLTIR